MTVPAAPPTTVDVPRVDDEATRLSSQRTDDEATRLNPKAPPAAVKRKAPAEPDEPSVVKRQRARRPVLLLLLAAGVVGLLLLSAWREQHASEPDAQRPLKHGKDDGRTVLEKLFNW